MLWDSGQASACPCSTRLGFMGNEHPFSQPWSPASPSPN